MKLINYYGLAIGMAFGWVIMLLLDIDININALLISMLLIITCVVLGIYNQSKYNHFKK